MARRIHLHIGPPKTGTSFLQAAWFQHRGELADQGVLYPGDRLLDQFRASAVALGKSRVTERMPAGQLAAWDRLTSAIRDWEGDAILSSEHYALASRAGARSILEELSGVADEVHVIATARDLARQVPASWQQSVKQGNDETFDAYWRRLAENRSGGFWRAQDLPSLLKRWSQGLSPDRVHVVLHGAPGSPRGLLWERVCGVTGVDPAVLRPVRRTNESLGVVHIELLRRINAELPADRDRIDTGRRTKSFVTSRVLAPSGTPVPLALPADARDWLRERCEVTAAELEERRYDVVGDLADLLPPPDPTDGRTPDSVTDAEVSALAAEAFARMLVHDVKGNRERAELRRRNRRLRRRLDQARARQGRPVRTLLGRAARRVTRARRGQPS